MVTLPRELGSSAPPCTCPKGGRSAECELHGEAPRELAKAVELREKGS